MMPIAVSVGAELYHRRLAAGLPIAQVARRVGISPSFLETIERNGHLPPARLVEEIRAAILELSGGYWDPFSDEYLLPEPR
ncbi:MAG: helix-turn-helix transcriptional regulator [Chloroflexota bacterium]|nr:helix-turn-helix domain-containing protein [Dehalococcoidia bacterium]MDW8252910.1 helix-turn-helix transcriptional regulator [Chloroflexota bacterium]